MMRGLGLTNSDLSLIKNTQIHESLGFELRVEFFNVFNQADIGPYPGYALATPSTFGKYLGVQHGARSLEIAGKIHF